MQASVSLIVPNVVGRENVLRQARDAGLEIGKKEILGKGKTGKFGLILTQRKLLQHFGGDCFHE